MNRAIVLLLPLLYSPVVSAFDYSKEDVQISIAVAAFLEGLDQKALSALCFVESSHNPKALNPDDGSTPSIGLCQVKYKTAKWLGFTGNPKDLYDPFLNAVYAARYLRYQLDRYGDMERAFAAYNAGRSKYPGYNQRYINKVKEAMLNE